MDTKAPALHGDDEHVVHPGIHQEDGVPRAAPEHRLKTRTGRVLEVREYGDPAGHPVLFFHGLIGSHHQASYISEQAAQRELRIIAPNRPGVGTSQFVLRESALDAVADVEDLTAALGIDCFSVIGISGGTPYALACLYRLAKRIQTITVISGMGPTRLKGGLRGMDPKRRLALEIGSRNTKLARRIAKQWGERFRAHPTAFLRALVSTWPEADRRLFGRPDVFDLFLLDLHQVFTEGTGPETFAQELKLYRNYGFWPGDLPANRLVTLWHGLEDVIVPPSMAWQMARVLPRCEAHFVPGGHFVAIAIAEQIVARLKEQLGAGSVAVLTGY
jgi:pimeloyl-ACP methyl ester carboxylesterase